VHACNTQGSWGAGIAKIFAKNFPRAYGVYRGVCAEAKTEEGKGGGGSLVGSALVIPPPFRLASSSSSSEGEKVEEGKGGKKEDGGRRKGKGNGGKEQSQQQFVACLFTSEGFGRKKASPERILAATESAMGDLLRQVGEWNRRCLVGERRRGGGGKTKKEGEEDGAVDDDEDDDEEEEDEEEGEDRSIRTIHMCKINAGLFDVPWEETLAVLERIPIPTSSSTEEEETMISIIEVISP
jgi:ADP-ribose 1''-phosphate phosphatase